MGNGWIEGNEDDKTEDPFDGRSQHWKVYAEEDGVKLEWVDFDYHLIKYTIVSYEQEKSFTVKWHLKEKEVFSVYMVSSK